MPDVQTYQLGGGCVKPILYHKQGLQLQFDLILKYPNKYIFLCDLQLNF